MASADATVVQVASDHLAFSVLAVPSGNREGLLLHNDSTSALWVKYGDECSATDFTTKLAAGAFFECQGYTGLVTGLWVATNGNAYVTELTD